MSGSPEKDYKESPVIILPDNEELKTLLEIKYNQYNARIDKQFGDRLLYTPPEVWESTDNGYRKVILSDLLSDGKIVVWKKDEELRNRHKGLYNQQAFYDAINVIAEYVQNIEALKISIQRVVNSSQ